MLHRLFNRGGRWHRPATLDKKAWSSFSFDMDWVNLNKMFNLKKFYVEIAPPFSRDAAPRVIDMEFLHDDILYYHVKKSWSMFLVWLALTGLIIDWDEYERPGRHFLSDDQNAHDFAKKREGFLT
jgi:hypothetical protein